MNTNEMSAVTILIVEKSGNVQEVEFKNYDESELYKKAGLKTPDGFKQHAQWNVEDIGGKSYNVSVFGKVTGRANQENKFEFPPPIDTTLFFGSCVIVNKVNGVATSITAEEWEDVYNYLYGGFEDLEDDEDEEDSEEDDDGLPRTKSGYVKDDFVVDDDEEEEEEEEDEEEELEDDDEEEVVYTKKTKPKAKKSEPKKAKKQENVFAVAIAPANVESYLDCTSELEEEEYFE
jgi:hypothetical protein